MPLEFEWDPAKARANAVKHGIEFMEATSAFGDPRSLTIPDPEHSLVEERFILLGMTSQNRIIVIIHTERNERIRIISARAASRKERKTYSEKRDQG